MLEDARLPETLGPVRSQRVAMLIHEPEVRHLAEGIVHGITHDTAIQEDLIQEALLHL